MSDIGMLRDCVDILQRNDEDKAARELSAYAEGRVSHTATVYRWLTTLLVYGLMVGVTITVSVGTVTALLEGRWLVGLTVIFLGILEYGVIAIMSVFIDGAEDWFGEQVGDELEDNA